MLACSRFTDLPEWCSGLDLAAGVDVLIHDSQYTDAEYEERVGWGHSTLRHAFAFADLAKARHLIAFHHDPAHDDAMLDTFFGDPSGRRDGGFTFAPAREGATFDVSAPANV
jgi:ribonuclease BN (tRNA processing enzyme)